MEGEGRRGGGGGGEESGWRGRGGEGEGRQIEAMPRADQITVN